MLNTRITHTRLYAQMKRLGHPNGIVMPLLNYIYIYILKGEVSKSNQTTECRMLMFIEK